jgi:LemA protein
MKKLFQVLIIVGGAMMLSGCSYNRIVALDESAKEAWNNVEAAYQRRSDLIGNLVETVKGNAKFEQTTLVAVIEARSKATAVQFNADQLTPENIAKFQEAQSNLSGALSRLLAVVENYPELKTNNQFAELMTELERTENRINIARRDFNASVKDYNTQIRSFPSNLTAMLSKFKQRDGFKADPGTEKAPKVQF